jgi:hypothetical protein
MTTPEPEPYIHARHRFVELMDGDLKAAAILERFLGWQRWIDEQSS